LIVAERGLKEIYGYEEPLPHPQDSYRLFDECLIWVRKAIHFVTAFNRTEQVFFAPMSVRRALELDAWNAGKKSGKWTLSIKKDQILGKSLFGNTGIDTHARHVRLRGAAVYVESKSGGTWRVRADAPRTSFVVWSRDNSERSVDQSAVPPLLALRARSRQGTFQTELLCTSHLHNVAPFGDWQITVDALSIEGIDAQVVDDIVIDFYLIAQVAP
jgi:hypothetical protein